MTLDCRVDQWCCDSLVDMQQVDWGPPRGSLGGLPGYAEAWHDFVDRLTGGSAAAEYVQRCAAVFGARLGSYSGRPVSDLEAPMARSFEIQAQGLRAEEQPPEEFIARCEELGAMRARQGITVSDLLQAYRLGCELLRARAYEIAPRNEYREALLLRLLELLDAWMDQGMIASAAGHRRTELAIMRRAQERKAAVVRQILSGTVPPSQLGDVAEAYGVVIDEEYFAVRARPRDDSELHDIEVFVQSGNTGRRPRGVVALIDGDVCGFVPELPPQPASAQMLVGVAGPVPLRDLAGAFHLATRALETAAATQQFGVFSIGDLGMLPAVASDHELGNVMLDRYVRPLERMGASAQAVLETVECYLANNGRIDKTARAMYLHTNTVRYRLGRFEELTGACLRDVDGLIEVWWALQRRKLAVPAST